MLRDVSMIEGSMSFQQHSASNRRTQFQQQNINFHQPCDSSQQFAFHSDNIQRDRRQPTSYEQLNRNSNAIGQFNNNSPNLLNNANNQLHNQSSLATQQTSRTHSYNVQFPSSSTPQQNVQRPQLQPNSQSCQPHQRTSLPSDTSRQGVFRYATPDQQKNAYPQQQTQLTPQSSVANQQFVQQPYNNPFSSPSTPFTNQQAQYQENNRFSGCNQIPQLHPHSHPHEVQLTSMAPVLPTNVTGNSTPNQPPNLNFHRQTQGSHQSGGIKHEISSTQQLSNIPSGLTIPSSNQCTQYQQSGLNQGPQFSIPSSNLSTNAQPQRPPSTLHVSQPVTGNFNHPTSYQESSNFQQQCHQSSAANLQARNTLQTHNPSGIPSICQQSTQSHELNQTGQFSAFNKFPLNSQHQINQGSKLAPISQMPPQQSFAINQFNNQQESTNYQQLQSCPQPVSVNIPSQPVPSSPACNQQLVFNQSNSQLQSNQTYSIPPSNLQCSASVSLPGPPQQANVNSSAVPPHYGPPPSFPNSFPPVLYSQHFGSYQAPGTLPQVNVNERDLQWVSQWSATRKKEEKKEDKRAAVLIPDIRRLLCQAFVYLKLLSHFRDNLKLSVNENDEVWERKLKKAANIKHNLNTIVEYLQQPAIISELISKLKKRKKKRALVRRQSEKRKMEKLEDQKRRLEKHRDLDLYMEAEKEKVLRAKREEEMKIEADNILSEVRRKLQEGRRAQESLKTIEKLRQARKDSALKRGLAISEETDDEFNKKISLLKDIVHKQLAQYDAEEKALKVMLETEQEGQREQEETLRKERQEKLLEKMQKHTKECLFGKSDEIDASHPLWYFRQYYTQAENNIEALVQIRRQWDMYIVRQNDAHGSTIPACWVTPDPPISHSWASAIDMNDSD